MFQSWRDSADQTSESNMNSRTSCPQRQVTAIFEAHCSATSREGTSTTVKPPLRPLISGYEPRGRPRPPRAPRPRGRPSQRWGTNSGTASSRDSLSRRPRPAASHPATNASLTICHSAARSTSHDVHDATRYVIPPPSTELRTSPSTARSRVRSGRCQANGDTSDQDSCGLCAD